MDKQELSFFIWFICTEDVNWTLWAIAKNVDDARKLILKDILDDDEIVDLLLKRLPICHRIEEFGANYFSMSLDAWEKNDINSEE